MAAVRSIIAHPADNSGCGWYRIVIPAHVLQNYENIQCKVGPIFEINTTNMRLDPGSLVVMHRQTEEIQLKIVHTYQRVGKRVLHDIDDLLWEVPISNPYRREFSNERRKNLDSIMRAVDVLTVSTVPLAEEVYRRYRRTPHVVPNVLIPSTYRAPRPRTGDKLRVGWAGTNTHAVDLERIHHVVRETKDTVQWVFMGYRPESLAAYGELLGYAPTQQYMQRLADLNLDVALAPLEHSRFNECKSNLKLIEFGSLGLPVISSDVYPYRANPGVLIKNSRREWKEWIDAIKAYDADDSLRMLHATATYEYANLFRADTDDYRRTLKAAWQ